MTIQAAPEHPGPRSRMSAALKARYHGGAEVLRTSRVAQVAVALVVVQLAVRTWMTALSWYTGDDFGFMSRMWNDGLSLSVAAEPYGGHVMPAGMYTTWLVGEISPYDFTLAGGVLIALQALADIGFLVLLVRMFGLRPGILPPLALYLFSAGATPMAVWWAAGINQIPFQVVLFWALVAHLAYLRTGRTRHAVVVVAWLVGGLLFYEKTLLVLGAIAIVTLAYFSTGSLRRRFGHAWHHYRTGVVLYVVLGLVYVAIYAAVGLNFSPGEAGNDLLGAVTSNLVFQAYAPSLAGGPLRWSDLGQWALPDAGVGFITASVLLIGYVIREIHRTRRRSLRAWWLPVFFLTCDILLVLAGRAALVGDAIALEYRYQSEMAAVTALALACAALPILGAVEGPEPKEAQSRLLDHPRRVAVLTAVVSVLGVCSSAQYALHWSENATGKPYFANLLAPVGGPTAPVPLIDHGVPNDIMWALTYPANLQSHLLKPYADDYRFVTSAVDQLKISNDAGELLPAGLPPVRTAPHGPAESCGYRITTSPRTIPLDGPVTYEGWWARIGYAASSPGPATVVVGDATYHLDLPAGLHALYVSAEGDFDDVVLSSDLAGFTFCTDEITIGRPEGVKATP